MAKKIKLVKNKVQKSIYRFENQWQLPTCLPLSNEIEVLGKLYKCFVWDYEHKTIFDKDFWKGNKKLNELDKIIQNKLKVELTTLTDEKGYRKIFDEALQDKGLNAAYSTNPQDFENERIVFVKSTSDSKIDNLIRHLRNTIAHASFGIYLNANNQKMLWLQDKNGNYITMRGIVSLENLLELHKILSNQ